MKIAIDMTPLKDEKAIQHRVRGVGTYLNGLKTSLEQFFPDNKYIYFTRGDNLPKDIDLVHYPYFEPFFLTLPLKKVGPTVVTVHDLTPLVFPEDFPVGIKGNLKWQIQKISLKGCRAVITDSENSKKDIIKFAGFPKDKIYVVYLAPATCFKQIHDTLLLQSIRVKYNLPEKFIFYAGDVTWNKNLPRLIEATRNIDVPLVMVGQALVNNDFDRDNPWNQDLVKVQEACEKEPRIRRLGFVSQEDLVVLYNLAAVFVMPSLYEGFGLPVLEAMACGCPVIAGRAGSLPEIVGEAGTLVDPMKTEEIADKLLKLLGLSSDERERIIQKGFAQSAKFSWQKTAKGTFEVYQKLASKGIAF